MRIAGFYSPPKAEITDMDNAGILARLAAANPDILLVAFGGPKQEKWCNMHIRNWAVPVSIGIGGSLDFIAGAQKRAPRWVQRLALEWLWRMLSNPRRLFRRYISNIGFFFGALVRLLWLRWGLAPKAANADLMTDAPEAARASVQQVAYPAANATPRDLDAFRTACETNPDRPLVVDMGTRDWLDSRELGEMLALNKRCRSAHRWLCVLAPHARLANMLRFVRLDRYIQVTADMQDALRRLHAWSQSNKDGSIRTEADRRLRVVLPAELTAASVARFKDTLDGAWTPAAEVAGITVDASGVTFLDSAGVGCLVALRRRAVPLPGGFRCAGFHGKAWQTLAIARLETLFADDSSGIGLTP